jgi:hypothetical protein
VTTANVVFYSGDMCVHSQLLLGVILYYCISVFLILPAYTSECSIAEPDWGPAPRIPKRELTENIWMASPES